MRKTVLYSLTLKGCLVAAGIFIAGCAGSTSKTEKRNPLAPVATTPLVQTPLAQKPVANQPLQLGRSGSAAALHKDRARGQSSGQEPKKHVLDVSGAEVLHSAQAKRAWYTDTWASPLVYFNKQRFFVYVTDDLKAVVGSISEKGEVRERELEPGYSVTDDGHNEFSIGVDKEGFLHIAGDMHNNRFRYWRSKAPASIAGFHKLFDDIPNTTFSYYSFHRDQNDELYLTARIQALDKYYVRGGRGVGLFKYDLASKRWRARGALPNAKNAMHPVIFWQDSGQEGGSYQMYKTDIAFDKNNRMHISFTLNADNAKHRHNYAVYAYSDDGGITFQRSDNTILTLPLSLEQRSATPDVLAGYKNADLSEHASVFYDSANRPAVYFAKDGATYYRFLDAVEGVSKWSDPILIRTGECERCRPFYSEYDSRFYISDGAQLYHGNALGEPMRQVRLPAPILRWERTLSSSANTAHKGLSGVSWDSKSGEWKIYFVPFKRQK